MDKRLQILIDRHQRLDDMVDEIQSRTIVTPRDKLDLRRLKVMRLRAKEAVEKFNFQLPPGDFQWQMK